MEVPGRMECSDTRWLLRDFRTFCRARVAVVRLWALNSSSGTRVAGIHSSDGEYPLASWNLLNVELPWIKLLRKDVHAIRVAGEAMVFSLETRASMELNKPLSRSTLPFLVEHLAGRSSILILCEFMSFFSTGWLNLGSELKYFGAPWCYIYTVPSLLHISAASFFVIIDLSPYFFPASIMFMTSYLTFAMYTTRKLACFVSLNSSFTCESETFLL